MHMFKIALFGDFKEYNFYKCKILPFMKSASN